MLGIGPCKHAHGEGGWAQVGDASAQQSPLSFGGFGAALRHAPRLVRALDDALTCEALSRRQLAMLHPYQPNLACLWLFQRCACMHAARGSTHACLAAVSCSYKPELIPQKHKSGVSQHDLPAAQR